MTSTLLHDPVLGSVPVSPAARRAVPGRLDLVRHLGDRLIVAQRPLRLLDSLRWNESVEHAFFAAGCRELPRVDRATYRAKPLPFDPADKRRELHALAADVERRLGSDDPAGRLLRDRCQDYLAVVDLLEARGTPAFAGLSARLFGTSRQASLGAAALAELAAAQGLVEDEEPSLDAVTAAGLLEARLSAYFGSAGPVQVRVAAGLASEAAAGTGYLKLRAGARFSPRDLRLLEVHEGWVHLGTTLNGLAQPACSFLSRATPAATVTQEGLAVLVEWLAGASHPARLVRLAQRVEAIALAEAGADFVEVYHHFAAGMTPRDSYQLAARVFRGSLPAGAGPFTKDLAYSRGLFEVSAFLRDALRRGEGRLVPLLFCGKVSLADVPTLAQLADEGLLTPPAHLPPPFAGERYLPGPESWPMLRLGGESR